MAFGLFSPYWTAIDKMSDFLLFPLLFFLVVLILIIKRLSSYLVKQFITKQGGKILESRLVDFRPGKYLARGDPVYQVCFLDRSGNEHKAFLHVNLLAGVYIEEDQIINSVDIQQR